MLLLAAMGMASVCRAQVEVNYSDTITRYNHIRLNTDVAGMAVLAGWGGANIAGGTLGVLVAQQRQWRYFHASNVAFGVLNVSTAAYMLYTYGLQSGEPASIKNSYQHFLSDREFYLATTGIDLLVTGAGLVMLSKGTSAGSHKDFYAGVGQSVALQGLCRLVFDNLMLSGLLRNNKKWYDVISDIRIMNGGVGFNYRLR